jgi:hypothetical protein
MWDKLQVVTYALLLVVAIWLFVATYEPLRSRAFGRPLGRRSAVAIRVTAGLAAGLCLVALVLDLFRNPPPARPMPGPFLGVPEDRARTFEDENPGVDSPLRGTTTMTEVQPSDYATYSRYKEDGRVVHEEVRGGFVYFAVKEPRHMPLAGGGGAASGASLTVIERFKAPLPKDEQ